MWFQSLQERSRLGFAGRGGGDPLVLGYRNPCEGAAPRFKVKEIPVEWKSGKGTKVNFAKDSWNMFWQVTKSLVETENKGLKLSTSYKNKRLATNDKPPIKIIPAQNTNHSLIIVTLIR